MTLMRTKTEATRKMRRTAMVDTRAGVTNTIILTVKIPVTAMMVSP